MRVGVARNAGDNHFYLQCPLCNHVDEEGHDCRSDALTLQHREWAGPWKVDPFIDPILKRFPIVPIKSSPVFVDPTVA